MMRAKLAIFGATAVALCMASTSVAQGSAENRVALTPRYHATLINKYISQSKAPIPYTPTVIWSGCPDMGLHYDSCALFGSRTIYMVGEDRHSFYHEIGHLLDFGMPQSTRTMFAKMVNDHRAWDDGELEIGNDEDKGASAPIMEWWADTYATCAQYGVHPYMQADNAKLVETGSYGAKLTLKQFQYVCRQIKYYVSWDGEQNYQPVLDGVIPNP